MPDPVPKAPTKASSETLARGTTDRSTESEPSGDRRGRPASPTQRTTPATGGRSVLPLRRFPTWLWGLLLVALVLFTINYVVASRAVQPAHRVRIPYSPFFLGQVRSGNVQAITTTGAAVQGTFRRPVRYPTGPRGTRATEFSKEIPAFADTSALSTLLQSRGVVINAEPLDKGTPWWQSLLYGFGPTLLCLALLLTLCSGSCPGPPEPGGSAPSGAPAPVATRRWPASV
jgi:cell division protease FtsH